jgi:transposase
VLCALWTIATSAVTVFKILTDGKAVTLAPLFGSKLGILVSDRATALLDYITIVFGHWHALKDGKLTRNEFRELMAPVRRHVEALLERAVKSKLPHVSGSCADILEHRAALWTFVTHEGVEPTNNHGELELRDFVLWRKRSFGSQSERGERFAERVMTAVRTARKQGKSVLDFVVRSVTARLDGTPAPRLIGAAPA